VSFGLRRRRSFGSLTRLSSGNYTVELQLKATGNDAAIESIDL